MTELVIATFVLSMVYAAAFVVVWVAWRRLYLELARIRERMHTLSRRCDVMQDTLDRYHAARMDEARDRKALWHSEALRRRCVVSPALIHDRVDRWLAQREAWVNATPERAALVETWRVNVDDYGATHPASRGCLLAITRDACGFDGMHPEKHDRIWIIRDARGKLIEGQSGTAFWSEAEALVAALEAAP